MATMPEAFGRYLRHEPINAELAAVRDGREPAEEAVQKRPPEPVITDAERELLSFERAALLELRMHAGWPVLMRLFEKAYDSEEKSAIAVSRQDPLSHKDSIANCWAYVEMIRAARNMVVGMVDREVEEYKRKTLEMVK